jgi:hypothetical protein
MKSFTAYIQGNLYRRVFKNESNKLILDYVSVGNTIPIIAEGEFLEY